MNTQNIQVSLLGHKIEDFHRLSDNYNKLLTIFIENPFTKFNLDLLSKVFVKTRVMSRITIIRFFKDMEDWGYINQMEPIEVTIRKGNIIRKRMMYEDNKPVVDKRIKYYRLTQAGEEIWEKQ